MLLAPNRRIDRVCVVIDAAEMFLLFLLMFLLMFLLPPCRHAKGSNSTSSMSTTRVSRRKRTLIWFRDGNSRTTAPVKVRPSPSETVTAEQTCTVGTDAPAAELEYWKALMPLLYTQLPF